MEEDRIKDLFSGFQPEMPEDGRFMESLLRSIDAVEMVRAEHRTMRRRSRLAMVLAAVAGFITGAVSMSFMPTLETMFAAVIGYSGSVMSKPMMVVPEVMSSATVGVLTVVMSVGVYYFVETRCVIPEKKSR